MGSKFNHPLNPFAWEHHLHFDDDAKMLRVDMSWCSLDVRVYLSGSDEAFNYFVEMMRDETFAKFLLIDTFLEEACSEIKTHISSCVLKRMEKSVAPTRQS